MLHWEFVSMKKTLTALMVAAGVVGFAGAAFADCSFHTAQSSKSTVPAEQSTPVAKPATTTGPTAQREARDPRTSGKAGPLGGLSRSEVGSASDGEEGVWQGRFRWA